MICGTAALIFVQLVPQGRSMIRLGISNVDAGFWPNEERENKLTVNIEKNIRLMKRDSSIKKQKEKNLDCVISSEVPKRSTQAYNIQKRQKNS